MKNVLIPLVLLLVASGAVHDAHADEMVAADTELVTLSYDLRGLVPDAGSQQQWLQVLPFKLHHDWGDGDDVDWFEEGEGLTDPFQELIYNILAPDEFSQANRDVEPRGDHTLIVTAPDAVHETIRATLEMVRAATHRRVVLKVDEFHLRRLPSAAEIADPIACCATGTRRSRRDPTRPIRSSTTGPRARSRCCGSRRAPSATPSGCASCTAAASWSSG
jgi:hypothetical protein